MDETKYKVSIPEKVELIYSHEYFANSHLARSDGRNTGITGTAYLIASKKTDKKVVTAPVETDANVHVNIEVVLTAHDELLKPLLTDHDTSAEAL